MNITTLYIYPSFWTVAIVRQYPHALFVFGDNDCGKGTGGQAIIRNEPNSIGLPTKKMPRNTKHSFYTDEEYADNCLKIDIAIQSILKVALQKKVYNNCFTRKRIWNRTFTTTKQSTSYACIY